MPERISSIAAASEPRCREGSANERDGAEPRREDSVSDEWTRIVTFDIESGWHHKESRDFAMLQGDASGDGMCIDSEGRLYVTAGDTGIQVFSVEGKHLGTIPLPRSARALRFPDPTRRCFTQRARA
jgi:hypothetical protein